MGQWVPSIWEGNGFIYTSSFSTEKCIYETTCTNQSCIFFPNLNRYTQKKETESPTSTLPEKKCREKPREVLKDDGLLAAFLICFVVFVSCREKSSQELKLTIYKHGSTYQKRRLISICRCVIIGGFVTWHVREMGSGVVVSHRISHLMSRARVAIFAALRSLKQTRIFWMMCVQWVQNLCAWQFLQTWPFWDGEFTWPFKDL